jgi:prepilin-type N-terminal cleavage/methylation domain-containing protein
MISQMGVPAPARPSRGGFSLVELVIAVVILSFGVLGMAGTTALIVRQVTMADVNTKRAAERQLIVERLRAANTNSITTGSVVNGLYTSTWAVSDSNSTSRTVRLILNGPGVRRDTAAHYPMLGAAVIDTFFLTLLRP